MTHFLKCHAGIVRALCSTTAVAALALGAMPASAQQTPDNGSAAAATPDQAAPAAAAKPADATGIPDIIVTAQRRSENVQKSSLPIQVVNADDLTRAGVSQAQDLAALVPGFSVTGGNTAQTFIRGVGDFGSTALGQSAIAYNLDGIYIADQTAIFPLYYDVQRIEVLKGPQGTLYGRNASGGAINIVTNRPKLDGVSGNVLAEVGSYNLVHTTGALNVPLSSTIAVRGAFNFINRDGYLSDGSADDRQRSGRLQFLYDDGERFSLLLSGDIEHRGGRGAGSVSLPHAPGNGKFAGVVDPETITQILSNAILPPFLVYVPGAGLPPAPGVTSALLHDSYVDHTQRGIMAEVNYDFGGVKATFIPAYRNSTNHVGSYDSASPFIANEKTEQQTYEFRLAHDDNVIKAVAGVYYMDLSQKTGSIVYLSPIPGLIAIGNNVLGTQSIAGFGQVTFSVSPQFRLIAGGRYTHEHRTIVGTRQPSPLPVIAFNGNADFNNFSYRAGAEYDITPSNMLYATASRGFKSGGFNTYQATPTQSNVYRPEILYAYTLGVRNRFADNKIQLNIEGYYWDYRNGQTSHLGFDPTGDLQFLTYNAAAAKIYGFEADLTVRPTPADRFHATLAYLHTKYSAFTYDLPTSQYHSGTTGCGVTANGAVTTLDCSGQPLPRSPQWSGSVSYQHQFMLKGGWSLLAGGDVNFATSRYLAIDYVPNEKAPGYMRANAFMTVNLPGDRISITGFINNIGNREVYEGGLEAPFSPGIIFTHVAAPRTYGMRVAAAF